MILRPGGTSWQIEDAERITFNNKKEQVRFGLPGSQEVLPNEYNKLTKAPVVRAGVLRRHLAGYLARWDGSTWAPTAPEGANFKSATSYAALWASAQMMVHKDRNDKSGTPLRVADLFAIIPGGDRNKALADFLLDTANFQGVGEKSADAGFEEWESLLEAVGPSLTGADGARVRAKLLTEMRAAEHKLSSGIAPYSDLEYGLKFVDVSSKAFPNDPEQKRAREPLDDRKVSLDRRMAILKALAAGELWDAFLAKYTDFERWDNSFPGLRQLHEKAYKESRDEHWANGNKYFDQKQYDQALTELRIAQQSSPGEKGIASLIDRVTIERDRTKPPPPQADPNSAVQVLLMRHIRSAEGFLDAKPPNLKAAEDEILQAEQVDKESPLILLVRAKVLRAEKQFPKSIEMLNQYEQRVPQKEWTDAEVLRGLLVPEFSTARESARATIAKAAAEGDYPAALASARNGLDVDPNDLDFLLSGGWYSAILRKNAEAERLLNEYLRLSQGPGSDTAQRDKVYNAVRLVKETVPEPKGDPNWFSGYRSPPGALYCPISLAFNARVSEVRGPKKQVTSYTWAGDLLTKVAVDGEPGEKPFTAYFEYYSSPRSVRRVSTEPIARAGDAPAALRLTPDGPVGPGTGVYTAMLNLPLADPLMVERLTGKRTAAIVAGNPYFHPFIWDGIYLFMVEYDDQGRVSSARQVAAGSPSSSALHNFEFKWDGWKLSEIDEAGSGSYRRSMNYAGGRLTSESISYKNAHPAKIEYKYKGDHLVEADCTNDPSLDGRSRHVLFR
ncbi:MAG: hypothetical protein ABSG65_01905 [Bryobacteraceae bacterium]